MKYNFIFLAAFLGLSVVSCTNGGGSSAGNAGSFSGTIYFAEDGNDKETLVVYSGTTLTTYTVQNGATVVEKAEYVVVGNKITVPAREYPAATFDCNGMKVTYSAQSREGFSVYARKESGKVILSQDGVQERSFTEASDEIIKTITNLPVCVQK